MALIEIREQRRLPDGRFEVGIRFGNAEEYGAVVGDPFAPEDEALLAWYFEEHLKFPFVRGVDARKAAASVKEYGEALFEKLFADRDAYLAYGQQAAKGIESLAWAVAGSEDFHHLHWEALKDPRLPRAFALEGPMVRQNLKPSAFAAGGRTWPTLHLLLVVARPFGPHDVGARTISRPLVETLHASGARVEVEILRPGTYKSLENHLQEVRNREGAGYYHAVHFDVHGGLLTYEKLRRHARAGAVLGSGRFGRSELLPYAGQRAFLFLEGDHDGKPADPVEAGEIARLLTGHQIPVAILNACQSGKPLDEGGEGTLGSRLLEAGLQVVLAMRYSVTVTAAKVLMEVLYRQLFEGKELNTAIRRGRLELHHQPKRRGYFNHPVDLEDWLLPVVYQNREVRFAVRDFTPEEARAWHREKERRFREPETAYGFFGRDLDVLAAERKLLASNFLLVRGMGGTGKTTLLQHLGAWWQETGWIEQVFYFGWDEKAWNPQQIGDEIAGRLLPEARFYNEYRALGPGARAAWLAEQLHREPHLLILDNLESITGSPLSIRNILPPGERETLRRFLADLRGGRTRVLLGSRGGEEWLAPGTFGGNVYELAGLDEEAASALAYQVLERAGARERREDEKLKRLLRLLAGYPLAIQVVLQNLARQSPQEIIEALQAGGALDDAGAQDKTESILRCIDYSYCHLSPEAQGLLACLAPFTGVVNQELLPRYTELLRQEPALRSLSFERWEETLQEAEAWGLLTPLKAGYLTVQPTLPYFLRARLKAAERAEERQAIERAFRAHYQEIGEMLAHLLQSRETQERQGGPVLAELEYENLSTALDLALGEQVSIHGPYVVLSGYLDARQDQRRGLELGQRVFAKLETFSPETLRGQLGFELGLVVNDVAKRHLLAQQYAQAEAAYQRSLHLAQGLEGLPAQHKGTLVANTYHQLGMVAQKKRQWEPAQSHYRQALQIYIELNDHYEQAGTLHQLGIVAEEQYQWSQAESYYHQALRIFIDSHDRLSQAGTYHHLGRVAKEQRQWQKAESHFQKALQIRLDFKDRYSQASTYYGLAMVAQGREQWERAERYYQKALEIYIDFKDDYGQASTYQGLGGLTLQQHRWEQAESYYQQALRIYIDVGDRHEQARTCHGLGIVAQQQHRWLQAESCYRQALQIYLDLNDSYQHACTGAQLGSLALEQRQWEQAREYLLAALETFVTYQDTQRGGLAFLSLASLWQESGEATLPEAVGRLLQTAPETVEKRFREISTGET